MATVLDDSTDLLEESHLAPQFETETETESAKPRRTPQPRDLTREQRTVVSTYSIIWLAGAHAIALFAFWTFSWPALIAMFVLHWLTGGIGICLGFHRYLTHTGFNSHPWVKYGFAVIGSLAGEGSPLDWVADHRRHHAQSDQPGDPHSPNDGAWWSHMFWLAYKTHDGDREAYFKRWIPDLAADKGMMLIDKLFLPLNFALAISLGVLGYCIGGTQMAVSMLIWGMFVRLVFVLHSTWLVNSASHLWGYRNYETTDKSRNNWWVALVTYGEGWHNNHHAYPRMAKHGHKWWELDLTFLVIRTMEVAGLVWNVVDYRNVAEKKAKRQAK